MTFYLKAKAFTLIEILIIIIIIGILAAIALPNYEKAKERALAKEAISNLKLIAAAEKIYKMESSNNAYVECSCSDNADCNNTTNGCNYLLKLSLTTQNWVYAVYFYTGSPTAFRAGAYRQGTGGYLDCKYGLTDTDSGEPIGTNCP